jgi:hypothetical protein
MQTRATARLMIWTIQGKKIRIAGITRPTYKRAPSFDQVLSSVTLLRPTYWTGYKYSVGLNLQPRTMRSKDRSTPSFVLIPLGVNFSMFSLTGSTLARGPLAPKIPLQMLPVRKQSTRICDITPVMMIDEAACLKKLTTYGAYTIHKVPPRRKSGRGTWLRAEVTEERLPQEDIINQIKKLSEKGRSAADKKKEMGQNREAQIASLLDDIATLERDPAFEWSLVQLDVVKKPVTSNGASLKGEAKASLYETVRITAYVERSPLKDLNPFILLENITKAKAESLLRRRPPPLLIPKPKRILPPKISAAKGRRPPPKFQPSSSSGSRKSDDKETASETDTSYSDETSWCSEEVSDTGSAKQDSQQDDKEKSDDVCTRTSK